MRPNFFIKYRGLNKENDSEINLLVLGESIIGFDQVIRDIFRISKIDGKISISATKTRKGSLIVEIIIAINTANDAVPFHKVIDLLNYLSVVDESAWIRANEFFGSIGQIHRDLNNFVSEYPLDCAIFGLFLKKILKKVGHHKKHPNLNDLPKEYALPVHKMIKRGKFKKAFKPFVENEVSSIEFSDKEDFSGDSEIDVKNFEEYLAEGEQILPQYINGGNYSIVGKIVGMQCSRGDSMNVRINIGGRRYITLVALPPAHKTTKDYDDFYGQNVVIKASVQRESLYQKPKLFITEIELQQQHLGNL